jgi:two-component system copper resistance phosphate regulon response regulator CusR
LAKRAGGVTRSEGSVLRYADVEMHLDTHEVFREGELIALTPKEFSLLEYFLRNPERVISKTEISEKVWDIHFDTGTNVVEVYVNFLRKKIEKESKDKLIHTQFKNGYMLRVTDAN